MSAPRIVVIGAGHMGRHHALKAAELCETGEIEFAGVVDCRRSRARRLARATRTHAFASAAAAFAESDAAIVAVPTAAHFEVVRGALEAGLDVLVEKPIAAGLDQAEALLDLARRRGRVLWVGSQEWHNPAMRAVRPKIERPIFIECQRVGPFSERGIDVDVVRDLMIHDLDILQKLLGAEPERIDATGVPVVTDKIDIASARIAFPGGCIANLMASRVSRRPMRKLRCFQRDGYFAVDFIAQSASIFRRVEARRGAAPRVDLEELAVEREDSLVAQLRAFVRAVVDGHVRTSTGDAALAALRTALRVVEAMPRARDLA
ncbi:MAG: Gfo/Idh/MocA family oxidoreductase [Deltaproteobacteria bacterium]|nr:Gfo/Idh/MocA family oxidoreductase [Deltaproteobacteria bacterium]